MHATSATGSGRNRAPRIGSAAGFTLLELLVVVAILVLLSSALPLALDRALPGRRVESTTRKLVSAIRDAQSASAASGQPVRLEFRESGVSGDRVSLSFPPTTRVILEDAEGLELKALAIDPEGSSTEAHIVISDHAHQRTLHLSGLTGRITIGEADRAR